MDTTTASVENGADENSGSNIDWREFWKSWQLFNESMSDILLSGKFVHFDPLGAGEGGLKTFYDIWWYIFFCVLVSSLVAHSIAAAVSVICLNKHRWNPWISLTIFVSGLLFPLFLGTTTSAALAYACLKSTAGYGLGTTYAVILGVGQTIVFVIVSFSKVLATL